MPPELKILDTRPTSSSLQCKTYKDKRGAEQLSLTGIQTPKGNGHVRRKLGTYLVQINVLNPALASTNFNKPATKEEEAE